MTQKQTYGSMEQNRQSRNKLTHVRSTSFQPKGQEYKMEKIGSPRSGAENVGQLLVHQ